MFHENQTFPKEIKIKKKKMLPCSTSPQLLMTVIHQLFIVIPVNSLHLDHAYYITWGGKSTRLEDDHMHCALGQACK